MTPFRAFTASLLLGISHVGWAWAADPVGTAAAVRPDVAVTSRTGDRDLPVGAPVYMSDVVKTDARGTAQIRFVDNTRLAIGPNSTITIDKFVFAGAQSAKDLTINVTEGAFRFLTGVSAKSAYTIKTPTATIGVRGTEWEAIYRGGVLKLGLFGGSLTVCGSTCMTISNVCDMIQVQPDGNLEFVPSIYERTEIMGREFAFAFRESRLLADFRVNSQACNNPNFDPVPNPSGHDDSLPPPEIDCGECSAHLRPLGPDKVVKLPQVALQMKSSNLPFAAGRNISLW